MADKKKTTFAAPSSKNVKPIRPSTTVQKRNEIKNENAKKVTPAVISRDRFTKPKSAKNMFSVSMMDAADMTLSDSNNFEEEYKQISYGKYLRSMLKDCFLDEKIERETTEIDIQMAQLAARFEKSIELLDKTNRRVKDISFISEQKRHAGYSYCGACAAFAYRQVSPVVVKRIFILGPSHHVRLSGCALSSMDKYRTPLYDLTIDKQIYAELEATRQFEWMDTPTDEDEHSIEMHLPYIAKVMEEYKSGYTIIPILVGSLTPEKEAKYGSILAPYLADPQNLVVISSDFCHWGSRFRYTWRDSSRGKIYQSIEWLDRQGMDLIEKMDPQAFTDYLNRYGNTICGRHPIGVLLQAIAKLRSQSNAPKMSLKFLKYAQSSQCVSAQDSSVSYASASLVFE